MSIKNAVEEIERYVASFGWDAPMRVFALVPASQVLEAVPNVAEDLPADVSLRDLQTPDALLSIEQEDLPPAASPEELLARIAWPETIFGAAISVERVTFPPEAEAEIPEDPAEAERFIATDPRREDVRMVAGVTREGEAWCCLRLRSHDADDEVLQSADLIPELVAALKHTFDPVEGEA